MRREYYLYKSIVPFFWGLPLHAQGILTVKELFTNIRWDYPCMRREYIAVVD